MVIAGVPAKNNPLGIKGAGEAGCVGALPCIQSALINAISPLGLNDIPMPATPFRIWNILKDILGLNFFSCSGHKS